MFKISFIKAVKGNEDDMKPGLKKPVKENQFWRVHSLNSPDPQLQQHTHLWEPKTERTYFVGFSFDDGQQIGDCGGSWWACWGTRWGCCRHLGNQRQKLNQIFFIFNPDLLSSEFEDCRHLGNWLILISTTGRRSSIRRLHTGDPRSSGVLVHRDIVYLSGQVGLVDENAQHGNKSKIS